ncbi:HAMP domain-containing sensor histidine kinase [Chitinophaga rhizosphaerae]|uniref:HAMP domain-containing sensor histidine kinase n=1 Tax=Chitinophaga rhizosphaerae TaxID=1864947 RepID=UPI000F80D49C|nr:HAMP domain-containing sensor histidine kinase [Chitinophaga rhizosphaerae]
MPVRLRITLLFTLLVFVILGVVCSSIYYFSAVSRLHTIKTRLANRAITSARLLMHGGLQDQTLLRQVDSLTTLALRYKSVQAYDNGNRLVYFYSDVSGDSLHVPRAALQAARTKGQFYFTSGRKEAVACFIANDVEGVTVVCAGEDLEGNQTLEQLANILMISFILGTLLSFAGGLLFSRGLLKPVRNITSEVQEISAYNLERRIHKSSNNDEWSQLTGTLNELLDRLKESFDMQRRFISNASHELSTPLTLISSQLEISLQRQRTEEEYRQAMARVLKDVRHMNNLVQTLLKFATASGNAGGLEIEMVRIDEVLMRIPGEIQSRDSEHTASLRFLSLPEEEGPLLVFGNEELLFSAILNIAANACKYSPDHHAEIYLEVEGSHIVIRVADAGIGMEKNELEHIMQPFYRIRQSGNVNGFGLGLALADRIIKLHKGTLRVDSEPGAGTTVTILLPARPII